MMNKPAVYKIKETSIIENIEYPIFKTNEIQCEEISDTAVQTIKPLVSVGMITYNHEPYIAQAIEGVLNQKTDFPFELVIGEDCSTDRTREIVLEYRNKHPDIIRVLVAEENVGAIRNLKRTLSACRGKYIAYCEGDDYWHHPLKLQKQADYLESHPDVGLIHSDVDCHFAASGKIARNRFANHPMVRSPREGAPLIENLITGEYIVMTSSVMARHALIDEVFTACAHEFSEEFLRGDIQMWIEIAYRSKFAYIEEALATYLVLTESASNSKNPYNIYRFWSKGIEIKLHYLQKYCDKSIRQLRTIVLKDYIREILRLAFRYRKPDIAQEALCRAEEEQIDLEILDTMYLHASNSPFFFYLMHTIRMVRKIGGKVYSILRSVF